MASSGHSPVQIRLTVTAWACTALSLSPQSVPLTFIDISYSSEPSNQLAPPAIHPSVLLPAERDAFSTMLKGWLWRQHAQIQIQAHRSQAI